MDSTLPVGKKHGCFTIVGGFEVYQEEVAKEEIERLEQDKQEFLDGERSNRNNFKSVDDFDRWIQNIKSLKNFSLSQ